MRLSLAQAVISVLLFAVIPGAADAQSYSLGAPVLWSANGHYYQTCSLSNPPVGYTFDDLEQFARSLSHAGMQGHLATYATLAEALAGGTNSERGYVGAFGNNTATGYIWSALAETLPLTVFGVFAPETAHPTCPPYSRIYIYSVGGTWRGSSNAIGCQPRGFGGVSMFTVEYEEGAVPVESAAWGFLKATYR